MSDFLRSSRRKMARAKTHVDDLERRQQAFLDEKPYDSITKPDPNHPDRYTQFLTLTKPLDPIFEDIVADAIFNLRAALDHATYAVAVAAGKPEPKCAYFPIAQENAAGLDIVIRGRCKDNFRFALFVAFAEVEGISGKPVLALLDDIGCEIDAVLQGIEAEAVRLGIFR